MAFSGAAFGASDTKVSMTVLPPLPAAGELVVSHHMAGIALGGFDPVAFFDRLRPVPGKPEHELQHAGATWRFANMANRNAFMAMPDVYAPLFGGYDPLGVTAGRAVAGLPQHFLISDSRLMIFSTVDTRDRFLASPGMLDTAVARWPAVERQLAR
ncbi:MAG: YHS domain-containing (seleno)protein [Bosea sp. (in: a-proteobacteria)]